LFVDSICGGGVTHLGRECVALDAVLGPKLVVQTVVYVDFVEAVAIRQRTASEIYGRLCAQVRADRFIVGGEDDTVACV
jgi:hypothetical protein